MITFLINVFSSLVSYSLLFILLMVYVCAFKKQTKENLKKAIKNGMFNDNLLYLFEYNLFA